MKLQELEAYNHKRLHIHINNARIKKLLDSDQWWLLDEATSSSATVAGDYLHMQRLLKSNKKKYSINVKIILAVKKGGKKF